MKYSILVYENAHQLESRNHPERQAAYWGSYMEYGKAMAEAGVMAPGGMPLTPPETATTVRVESGRREVQDGPYADTKEQLGGVFVIDVPDLDTALEWAAKCPSATTGGAAEVRPVLIMPAA